MAMVSVVVLAAYRRIWGSDRSVWSKGQQPPGARAVLAKWTSGSSLLRWQHHKHCRGYYYYSVLGMS